MHDELTKFLLARIEALENKNKDLEDTVKSLRSEIKFNKNTPK